MEAQKAELAEWNRTLEERVADGVSELERLSRMKRFFSPQVADLITSGDARDPLRSHRAEITVVFIDLRGYTAFTESAEPEDVMHVLREYHAEMGRLIMKHNGTVERFAGDAIMIFFNDPIPLENPAEHAVRLALDMHEAFERCALAWRKRGFHLQIGIGVAQGYATIGAIGFEGRLGLRRDWRSLEHRSTPVFRSDRRTNACAAARARPSRRTGGRRADRRARSGGHQSPHRRVQSRRITLIMTSR